VISSGDLYCWLLPQCKALRTCCSGFLITTIGHVAVRIAEKGNETILHRGTYKKSVSI